MFLLLNYLGLLIISSLSRFVSFIISSARQSQQDHQPPSPSVSGLHGWIYPADDQDKHSSITNMIEFKWKKLSDKTWLSHINCYNTHIYRFTSLSWLKYVQHLLQSYWTCMHLHIKYTVRKRNFLQTNKLNV